MPINFCIGCKVGLANEEVVNGVCKRFGSHVVQKGKSEGAEVKFALTNSDETIKIHLNKYKD